MSSSHRSAILTACVVTLLALHFWLGVSATFDKSVTGDETAHITGGYSYWKFDDYRLQPENGNLPQRWAALPLLLEKPKLNTTLEPGLWSASHVWLISQRFLFESGNNTDFMVATSRACMALWSVATGLLVFFWSRQLWGATGGLFSLALYAFSATTLAHGPLITSDMTVTFFLLVATGAYWRHWERPSITSLALSLLATGLAAVAKFSFLLLIPVYGLLILWWMLDHSPLVLIWRNREYFMRTPLTRIGVMLISTLAHILAAWLIIWMFFGFRFSAFATGMPVGLKFYIPWEIVMPEQGFWHAFLATARNGHLLPDAYLQGFAYVNYASQTRGAFLNGEYSNTGWFSFFPWAFLIKTPWAELVAFALAALVTMFRWRKQTADGIWVHLRTVAPLLALFLVYAIFSLTSHLNIGHRHILPLYPVLFILAGLLARPTAAAILRATTLALALAAAATALAIYPNYLAYFNVLGGGSAQGYRHLVDSSLDWGQELPTLARWLKENRHPGEPAYLAYFGNGDPAYEGIIAEPLAPYYYQYRPRIWVELKPGLYCISATMLQDVYSACHGPWLSTYEHLYQSLLKEMRSEIASGKRPPTIAEFGLGDSRPLWTLDRLRFARLAQYLRLRTPDAVLNHSMFIYRLDAQDIHTLVDGSLADLATLMEKNLQRSPR